MEEIDQIKAELSQLALRTPKASRIDTINKVRAFKRIQLKASKLKNSKNVEELRSTLAELKSFHQEVAIA